MINNLQTDINHILYDQFLRCMEREQGLIHYRTTWGMQWNAAGFASLFGINNISNTNSSIYFLIALIVVASALCASVLTFFAIDASQKQIDYLIKSINHRLNYISSERLENLANKSQNQCDESKFLRPYGEYNKIHRNARIVSKFIPLVFSVVWSIIFLYLLTKIDISL